jgi:Holliday junction resolvase RusA-like endonuclease
VTFESNAKGLKAWRLNVRTAAVEVRDGRDPLDGPVVLTVVFTRPKPVSAPKRKPCWPWTKPDWDKLARAVCDGLKDGGVYKDDARVVRALVVKSYPLPREGRPPLYRGSDAEYMTGLWDPASELDVLNVPGAVIRVAHLTEFESTRKQLAEAGYEPKDITGGC